MAKQTKKKMSKYEKKRRRTSIIVGILAGGMVLSTLLGILIAGIS